MFAWLQFGQGWVAGAVEGEEPPPPPTLATLGSVPDVTGPEPEREGLPASGAEDGLIGAPHVSQ